MPPDLHEAFADGGNAAVFCLRGGWGSGRLLRDNIYGTIDQDVWRRDFTCNALYYNIEDFSIWDYVGGAADVRERSLRLIRKTWQKR